MSEKNMKVRHVQKHDVEANWLLATGFAPKAGEIIVYDEDATHTRKRIKIGDGTTNVNVLPFVGDVYVGNTDPGVNSGVIWVDTTDPDVMVLKVVNNDVWAVISGDGGSVQPDWTQNDDTATDYVKNRTHWAEPSEVALVDNVTVDFGEYTQGFYEGDPLRINGELEMDTIYTIIIDGIEYTVTGQWDSGPEKVYLGDNDLTTGSGDDDPSIFDPPFYYDGSSFYTSTGGTHTVTIAAKEFQYHKIDANFLPDGASIGVFGTGENAELFNLASTASGFGAHAEGGYTTAGGLYSHAEGYDTTASADYSHAEGRETTASGQSSHAEGNGTTASGSSSHAEGLKTTASSSYQHVQGTYNIEDANSVYAHIVGNGDYTTRSNAHTIDWDGNGWFAGDVKVGGTSQSSSDAKTLATTEYVDNAVSDAGVYVQDTEPTDAEDGAVWVDTSNDPSFIEPNLPEVTTADNGKILMVVNGKWQAVDLNLSVDADGVLSV